MHTTYLNERRYKINRQILLETTMHFREWVNLMIAWGGESHAVVKHNITRVLMRAVYIIYACQHSTQMNEFVLHKRKLKQDLNKYCILSGLMRIMKSADEIHYTILLQLTAQIYIEICICGCADACEWMSISFLSIIHIHRTQVSKRIGVKQCESVNKF